MKRPRPYIPLSVRVQVVERQLISIDRADHVALVAMGGFSLRERLPLLIGGLGFKGDAQLDHDPALILRRISTVTGDYVPPANDPNFLIYRDYADHQQKTTGRKPGALRTVTTKGSDVGLKAKFNRLEGRTKPKRKAKIAQRKNPWPKRKFPRAKI